MSLFRFGFTRKSLATVTKSGDIQATQQLNSTKLKEPDCVDYNEIKLKFFTVSRQWYRMTSRLGFMLGIIVFFFFFEAVAQKFLN